MSRRGGRLRTRHRCKQCCGSYRQSLLLLGCLATLALTGTVSAATTPATTQRHESAQHPNAPLAEARHANAADNGPSQCTANLDQPNSHPAELQASTNIMISVQCSSLHLVVCTL